MRDVAERAGVHPTTVSMALRNHPRISRATKERLRSLAEEMGYQPDPMLSALNLYRIRSRPIKSMPTVAYIVDRDPHGQPNLDYIFREFYEGAVERASSSGYRLEVFVLDERKMKSERLSQILETRGVVGVVLSPLKYISGHVQMNWDSFCAVRIDPAVSRPHLHEVCNNQIMASRLATRRAFESGYRNVGFVENPANHEILDGLGLAGYLLETERIGPQAQKPIYWCTHKSDLDSFANWIRENEIEVIVSDYTDTVLSMLEMLEFRVPNQIGFISTDNNYREGQIAGVRLPHREVGRRAIEHLLLLINLNLRGEPEVASRILVDCVWQDGATLVPANQRRKGKRSSKTGANHVERQILYGPAGSASPREENLPLSATS